MKDIDLIDLLRRYDTDTPCEGLRLNDRTKLLTLMFGELLRVRQQGMIETLRQDYRSCDDGTR